MFPHPESPQVYSQGGCSDRCPQHPLFTDMLVKVTQSYPVLSDPMGCGLPGSSVHGILQARKSGLGPRSPTLQADSLSSEPPAISRTYLDPIEGAYMVSCSIHLIPWSHFNLFTFIFETKNSDSRCVSAYIPLLQYNSPLIRSFFLSYC